MPVADFRFVGGRPCIDLVATLGKRHARPIERLADRAAAARWLVLSGVLPANAEFEVSAAQLTALRRLREAIFRLVRAAMASTPLEAADVAELNDWAARRDLAPSLVALGAGAVACGKGNPVDAAIASIARDAVRLLAGPSATRVKKCANPDCSLLFVDESQSSRRRWCSMDRCGNLAKVHGYRQRASTGAEP